MAETEAKTETETIQKENTVFGLNNKGVDTVKHRVGFVIFFIIFVSIFFKCKHLGNRVFNTFRFILSS